MEQDIILVDINIRIWRWFAVVYPRPETNWRKYVIVLTVLVTSLMQSVFLVRIWGDWPEFLLNLFLFMAILDALLRTLYVIYKHSQFEQFLEDLAILYRQVEASGDEFSLRALAVGVREARLLTKFNIIAGLVDISGSVLFSWFGEERVFAVGVALPGVDMEQSPAYEIFSALQLPLPIVLSVMYMVFFNLFVAFALFAKVLLQILVYKLNSIEQMPTEEQRFAMLIACIRLHITIAGYVRKFSDLCTYIVGVEAFNFSGMTVFLLFCLNIVGFDLTLLKLLVYRPFFQIESRTQFISAVMYLMTLFYVLFNYYNRANDLVIECARVSEAVYNVPWMDCGISFRKTLLIFLMQSQRPLVIKLGNVYPMNLGMFQRLLNASYSFFTMLRGVTNK